MDNLNPEYNKIEMFGTALDESDEAEIKVIWHTWELSLTPQTIIGIITLMVAVRVLFFS
jgi:hypothetical protein